MGVISGKNIEMQEKMLISNENENLFLFAPCALAIRREWELVSNQYVVRGRSRHLFGFAHRRLLHTSKSCS